MAIVKRLFHATIDRLGYRLIKKNLWRAVPIKEYDSSLPVKYLSLISNCYSSFKAGLLPDLPEPTAERCLLLSRLIGTGVMQGLHILDSLSKTKKLPGDVCEFGIAQGATSVLLANELIDSSKCLWLFDSFKGLSKPSEKDKLQNDIFGLGNMAAYEGVMACSEDMVRERLREIPLPSERIHIINGFVEDSLKNVSLCPRVAFAFIDLDLYQPIRLVLDFLHERLSEGGIIVVHDYGHFSTGARAAVDEFLDRHVKLYQPSFPKDFNVNRDLRRESGAMCIMKKVVL